MTNILNSIFLIGAGIIGIIIGISLLFIAGSFYSDIVYRIIHLGLVNKLFDETLHLKWLGVIIEIPLFIVSCFGYFYCYYKFIPEILGTVLGIAGTVIYIILYICMIKMKK